MIPHSSMEKMTHAGIWRRDNLSVEGFGNAGTKVNQEEEEDFPLSQRHVV